MNNSAFQEICLFLSGRELVEKKDGTLLFIGEIWGYNLMGRKKIGTKANQIAW